MKISYHYFDNEAIASYETDIILKELFKKLEKIRLFRPYR